MARERRYELINQHKLTNNLAETDIDALMAGDVVFSTPFFQRNYRWKLKRLRELNQDILNIVDQNVPHFLGALILHGRGGNPADPKIFEVIDGQQRIITLYLYLAALVRVLSDHKQYDEAAGIFMKYLAIPRDTKLYSNLKLHPCKEDRPQLNFVIEDLLSNKVFKKKVGSFNLKFLPSSDKVKVKGVLVENYNMALSFFRSEYEQGQLDRVRSAYQAMLLSVRVVQIDVLDPTNGPNIFNCLNARQEPMTIGDLVRNEIFSRIADQNPDYIEQIDQHYWQPFYNKFQEDQHNWFDKYFFPYGLIQNPNIKKSEVYSTLRDAWSNKDDPKTIIDDLRYYQDAFIDIVRGKNTQKHPKKAAELFKNIFLLEAPSSVYPFLMQLSLALNEQKVSEKDACESLQVIESFLVRRATCGHEPTGLHAVFKRLWVDCDSTSSKDVVKRAIAKHKTVVWPNAEDFKKVIRTRPLYGVGITSYLLREYNRSLGGDIPETVPWIEHVLPKNPSKYRDFSKEQHDSMKDLLANLIPLSEGMNVRVSNKPYAAKRPIYERDAMFKSAREFAKRYVKWTPVELTERSEELAQWAEKRWKF